MDILCSIHHRLANTSTLSVRRVALGQILAVSHTSRIIDSYNCQTYQSTAGLLHFLLNSLSPLSETPTGVPLHLVPTSPTGTGVRKSAAFISADNTAACCQWI